MEQALRFAQFSVDRAVDAVFWLNADGQVVYVNDTACRMLGYSRTELLGMTVHDIDQLFPPAEWSRRLEKIQRAGTSTLESRYRTKGGSTFPVEISASYLDFNGRAYVCAFVRDITERKRAEQERELLYQLARCLARSSDTASVARHLLAKIQGIFHADSGFLLLANPEGTALHGVAAFGMENDVFRQERFRVDTDQIPASEVLRKRRPVVLTDWIEAYGARVSDEIRERYRFVKSVWAVPLMSGETIVGVLLIGFASPREATEHELRLLQMLGDEAALALERTRLTDELRTGEERYRSLFENANDSILCLTPDGILTNVNRGLEVMLGWPREAMIGRHYREFLTPASVAFTEERTRRIQAGEKVSSIYEVEAVRRDGTVIPLEARSRFIRDAAGRPTGILAIHRDITERKRMEEELRRAKEGAEAASQAKSEFLANMSHEIRTPMNGILGMLELALTTPLTPEQREYLDLAKDSADALLGVLNDILDFSKIEAGKLHLDPCEFHLRDRLSDTVQALAPRAHQKGLELLCHVEPEVPDTLVGDLGRLRQVIMNLIGNAIKFTDRGEVSLGVSLAAPTSPESAAQAPPPRDPDSRVLHFAVRDTGIGIPVDKRRLIFDPFAQADGSTTRKYGGTGLGLAISSQLVTLMGGRIWVESEVGTGSTFHFTARFGILPGAQPPAPAEADLRDLPVLVVDDNATNRHILTELLTRWRLKPTPAASGREAIAALRRAAQAGTPFPLMLLDVCMPEMDGFALAAQIRQRPELAGTAVILLTSGGQPDDAARCRELGISRCLMKPVRQSDLQRALFDARQNSAAAGPQVSLPALPPRGLSAPRAAEQAPGHARLRILLVEDNAVNQTLAVRLLEKQGYSVAVVNNGREALDALAEGHFDVVLMDVQMPEMDGLEATAAIRARERLTNTHLPIVAMTAHAMQGDRERCLAAGMDGYVSKPLKPADLFAAIEDVAGQRGPGKPAG
jgi:PAS domain S-box-containing protein